MMTKSADVIFRSKLPDIPIPSHLPIHSYCFENISQHLTRPCLINGANGETHTYEQVELTSRKVAAGLSRLGVRQGDTVMLILRNTPEFVYAFLGASFIGASSTMANPDLPPADLLRQARITGAKLILADVDGGVKEANVKVVKEFSDLLIITSSSDELAAAEIEIEADDVAAVPYSSGTTGMPKGVMLTHRALVTNVAQQVDGENPNMHLRRDDVMMCVLPLFHMYSLNLNLLCGLRVGAAIVLVRDFETESFLEMTSRYRATIALLVPPIVLAIAKSPAVADYDLSSVRRIMSGAAPLGKGLEDSVRAKFPNAVVGQGYGMTEGGPVLTMCLGFAKEPIEMKPGSSGVVLRNTEMKIVDPATGASLGRNQPGEVYCRGDQIMKGYLDVTPDSTQSRIDKDGWLLTDDIGFVDDDDELFIVDRSKEIIVRDGFQVAPAELEAILLIHPNISDAAVVPLQDEEAGEVPIAFVVKCSGSTITEDEIKQFVSEQVEVYKRISHVVFVDVIPKAATGKILRRELRARVADGLPN